MTKFNAVLFKSYDTNNGVSEQSKQLVSLQPTSNLHSFTPSPLSNVPFQHPSFDCLMMPQNYVGSAKKKKPNASVSQYPGLNIII